MKSCAMVASPDSSKVNFMLTERIVHSRTGHECPKGEWKYSSTPSLTSAVGGGGWSCHALWQKRNKV